MPFITLKPDIPPTIRCLLALQRHTTPLQDSGGTARPVGLWHGHGHPGKCGWAREVQVLYQTFGDLRVYCYRVASVVGLVCIRIFGYRDAAAEPLAENLGLAFQLTNIIRDIKEDAGMGRIYLPADDMASFKVATEDFRQRSIPERLQWLLAAEADRAREYYGSARDLITLIDEDSRPALWVLVSIYAGLLEKIADRKYDVFGKKISLTAREKAFILGKGLLKRLA